MKFIFPLAPLLSFISVAAFPATDSRPASISTAVVPKISLVNSTFYEEGKTLERRVGAEHVFCYNAGVKIDRAWAIQVIDSFCGIVSGKSFAPGTGFVNVYSFRGSTTTMTIGVQAINDCTLNIPGDCGRLLRQPIDKCNTGGENGKQGGEISDNCGLWRADPGEA